MKRFFLRRKKNERPTTSAYGWFGNYESWQAARQATNGYAQSNILEKTRSSLAQVRDGLAVYERDSVLFSKKEYPFSLISCLLYIAAGRGNALRVLDFGGSLGTTFYQVREFLSPLNSLHWHIVEQAAYVEVGQREFQNEQLRFFGTISDSLKTGRPDVILLSSVVQYLEDPHAFLADLAALDVPFLLFDRTAFVREGGDRLTIQHVPPDIYDASYPAWFFEEESFMKHFDRYEIMAEFTSYVVGEADLLIDGVIAGSDKGFLMRRKL